MVLKCSGHLPRCMLIFGCVICLSSEMLRAAIGIKPAYVEVKIDKGRPAGRFLISNLGDKLERYRINALHFTYSEEGALKQAKTGKNSLAQWIYFNPRELILPPKTQRAVRFAIVPRGKLQEGEYWASMELESLNVNVSTSKSEKTGRTVQLKTITAIMVPIFGTVGKVKYEGLIKDAKLTTRDGAIFLRALVAATGTGRIGAKGRYEIRNASGQIVDQGPLAKGYILRGSQRWFTKKMETNLPDGVYTLRVIFDAVHLNRPLVKQVQVNWTKPQPVSENDDKNALADLSESDRKPERSTDGDNQPKTHPSSSG